MKKTLSILPLLLFLSVVIPTGLFGQVCNPDAQYTTPGVYPDTTINFPPVCAGAMFEQVVTLVVPSDTIIDSPPFPPLSATIDSLVITGVTGLPAGFTYQCGQVGCNITGGTSGCVLISGMADQSMVGIHELQVNVTFYTDLIDLPFTYPGYKIVVYPQPTVTVDSVVSPSGCSSMDGELYGSADGSVGPYLFSWNTSPIQTTPSITGLPAGEYTLTVSDFNGCENVETASLSGPDAPEITSVVSMGPSCFGVFDGSIAPIIANGVPPFTYEWSNMAIDSAISGLGSGMYDLTVSDAVGCQAFLSGITLTEPSAISVSLESTDLKCFGQSTGTVMATVSGGTAPLGYSWNTGQSTAAIGALPADHYVLTITDDNGCSTMDSVDVMEAAELIVTVEMEKETCESCEDGSGTVTVTGGTAPYSILWSTGDTTDAISGLAPGNYSVAVEDSNGCATTVSDTVMVVLEPQFVKSELKLFPNPASETFSIESSFTGNSNVQLMDIYGKVVYEDQINFVEGQSVSIPVSGFSSGIYLVSLSNNQNKYVSKLSIK